MENTNSLKTGNSYSDIFRTERLSYHMFIREQVKVDDIKRYNRKITSRLFTCDKQLTNLLSILSEISENRSESNIPFDGMSRVRCVLYEVGFDTIRLNDRIERSREKLKKIKENFSKVAIQRQREKLQLLPEVLPVDCQLFPDDFSRGKVGAGDQLCADKEIVGVTIMSLSQMINLTDHQKETLAYTASMEEDIQGVSEKLCDIEETCRSNEQDLMDVFEKFDKVVTWFNICELTVTPHELQDEIQYLTPFAVTYLFVVIQVGIVLAYLLFFTSISSWIN